MSQDLVHFTAAGNWFYLPLKLEKYFFYGSQEFEGTFSKEVVFTFVENKH